MSHNGNAHIDNRFNRGGHMPSAFQFHGVHTRFLHKPARIAHRFFYVNLI